MEKMKEGRMVTNLLSSNDPLYRDHYNTIFKELWKTGIDAKSRIKDIEEGRYISVDIMPNPKETMRFVSELNKSAKKRYWYYCHLKMDLYVQKETEDLVC